MENKIKKAIKEYQCPGCVTGIGLDCYEKGTWEECKAHTIGTLKLGVGWILLGMPRGFNHVLKDPSFFIFKSLSDGWGYDHLNVPVWKFRDMLGNTLVRGLIPRIGIPFIHIYLEDCLDQINCHEVTKEELDKMD